MAFSKIKFLVFGFIFLINGLSNIYAQQRPVFYGGFEYYRHTAFKSNAFYNVNLGAQVYQWKFLAPELGFEFYSGFLEDQEFSNPNYLDATAPSVLKKSFAAALFSVAPKLRFGKDDAFITFTPKYNIGTVNAKGTFFVLENNQSNYDLEEQQKTSAPISFWSFSLAVEGLAIRTDTYWFTLSLNYTYLNAGTAFEKLDFSEYNVPTTFSSTSSIGLGMRFYWDIFSEK